MDGSGIQEGSLGGLDAMAGEVAVRQPDLILITPGALSLAGDNLVNELNRRAQFQPGYAWTPALGELPES